MYWSLYRRLLRQSFDIASTWWTSILWGKLMFPPRTTHIPVLYSKRCGTLLAQNMSNGKEVLSRSSRSVSFWSSTRKPETTKSMSPGAKLQTLEPKRNNSPCRRWTIWQHVKRACSTRARLPCIAITLMSSFHTSNLTKILSKNCFKSLLFYLVILDEWWTDLAPQGTKGCESAILRGDYSQASWMLHCLFGNFRSRVLIQLPDWCERYHYLVAFKRFWWIQQFT